MRADPYLFFDGRSAEAFKFYGATLGATLVTLVRRRDLPGSAPGDAGEKVMHAVLKIGDTTVLASDFGNDESRTGFALSLQVDDDAQACRVFAALSEDGRIVQALNATPFASSYGRLVDRFGVPWLIVTRQPPST
jgi:PhnB protein